jgi:hypothetical protein
MVKLINCQGAFFIAFPELGILTALNFCPQSQAVLVTQLSILELDELFG